jgi:hypothetical protein
MAIYASGHMVLSGDGLTTIPEPRLAMLKNVVHPAEVWPPHSARLFVSDNA